MLSYCKEMLDDFFKLLPTILISATGGVVSYLNRSRAAKFTWLRFFAELLTAAFTGFVVHCLLMPSYFPDGIRSAAIAISGYASRDVLYLIKARFLKEGKKII